jgi:hypothetical protein
MEMEGGVIVTLDELKEAVDIYHNGHANDWPLAAEVCATFTREYIAREQLLDTELTAEICERLGMVKDQLDYHIGDHRNAIEFYTPRHGRPNSLLFKHIETREPTIRHLLAAACLAGVTVDLSRLDQPAIDI